MLSPAAPESRLLYNYPSVPGRSTHLADNFNICRCSRKAVWIVLWFVSYAYRAGICTCELVIVLWQSFSSRAHTQCTISLIVSFGLPDCAACELMPLFYCVWASKYTRTGVCQPAECVRAAAILLCIVTCLWMVLHSLFPWSHLLYIPLGYQFFIPTRCYLLHLAQQQVSCHCCQDTRKKNIWQNYLIDPR